MLPKINKIKMKGFNLTDSLLFMITQINTLIKKNKMLLNSLKYKKYLKKLTP